MTYKCARNNCTGTGYLVRFLGPASAEWRRVGPGSPGRAYVGGEVLPAATRAERFVALHEAQGRPRCCLWLEEEPVDRLVSRTAACRCDGLAPHERKAAVDPSVSSLQSVTSAGRRRHETSRIIRAEGLVEGSGALSVHSPAAAGAWCPRLSPFECPRPPGSGVGRAPSVRFPWQLMPHVPLAPSSEELI